MTAFDRDKAGGALMQHAEDRDWTALLDELEGCAQPTDGITLDPEEAAVVLDLVQGNIAGTEDWWRRHAHQKLDAPKAQAELIMLHALAKRLKAAQ